MPGDDNPIQSVLHWRPAGLRSGNDSTASGEEKKALVSTPPRPHTPPPLSKARATRVWDVKMPPAKKTMVGGRLVPTMGGTVGSMLLQKKRRISVEIHVEDGEAYQGLSDNLSPGTSPRSNAQVMQGLLRGESMGKMRDNDELHVGENVIVRLLKPATEHHEHDGSSDEGDSHSVSTLGIFGADEEQDIGMWTQAHIYDLDDVQILKARRGGHCQIKFGHGSDTQVREVNYSSEKEASSFCQVIEHLRALQSKRTEQRVHEFRSLSPDSKADTSRIQLLVEIVSGIRLPIADASTSDPYVIVRMGAEEVHRTKPIYNSINPIWTIDTGSLFLLSVTPEAFFATATGLSFFVKDYDAVGKNDVLGRVVVGQEELLHGKGERKLYALEDTAQPHHPGRLVLRFRKATSQDVIFMERLASAQKSRIVGVYADETLVPPRVTSTGLLKREHRKVDHKVQMRVKPERDPERPNETKWMTSEEIDAESEKPSKKWIEAGSGQLGKLFVEIIACDGLPNMDTAVLGGGKTDAFASLIYEDCIVNTEVINDVLSPRWMPWTHRAFIFHITHPSSQLMVGVFDYDSPTPMAEHDGIGRAAIDITNFRPGTEYTLYYDLYTSAIVKKRKSKGQIKLRIRIEIPDGRKCILAAVKLPPENYINVATSRDYRVVTFVCEGKYNIHKFNMDLLAEYVEELRGYESVLPILQEAALTVVFWRGHYPVVMRVPQCPPMPGSGDRRMWDRYTKQITIRLPLHSVTAFVGGVLLADNFNFLPAFILFAVAWILLATSAHVTDNPSPWNKRRSFLEIFNVLVTNSSPVETIQPYENKEAIQQFLAEKKEIENKREEARKKKADEDILHEEVKGELDDDGGEVQMGPSRHGFGVQLNPLKPILFPMQQNLEFTCRIVRIVRSFVTWEESINAFWIVILAMLGGLLLLFVPWGFILQWIFRVSVWVLLGPWMKLVDWLYIKKPRTTEEEQKEVEARLRSKYKELLTMAVQRQTVREEKTKLKDMKRYMFGKYLAVIPRFKQSRYVDCPLPASHASPFVANTSDSDEIVCRKYGQFLSGDMIPKREIDELTETSTLTDKGVKDYGSTDQASWQPQFIGNVLHKMDPRSL